jgi:hypothetical protein
MAMDDNTILELEALKMEARAIEASDANAYDKSALLGLIAARIRALKTERGGNIGGEYPRGMTVADLKELIKNWPDFDQNGEPNEVFLETGDCLSGPAISAWHLNGLENDLLLGSGAWDKEADNG